MTDKREYVAGEADPEAEAFDESQFDQDLDADPGIEPDPDEGGAAEGASAQPDDAEETLARAGGWCPKEEWRGDPAKWVDAKTFNDSASPARMRERFQTFEQERAKEREEYSRRIERIEKLSEESLQRQQAQFDAEIANLKRQRDQNVILAARNESEERAEELATEWDTYIANKEKERPTGPQVEQPQPTQFQDPEEAKAYDAGRKWAANKPWAQGGTQTFDREAFRIAHGILSDISEDPRFKGNYDAQFQELDRRLTGYLPKYYGQQNGQSNGNGQQRGNGAPPANARQMDGVRISGSKNGSSYSSRLSQTERQVGKMFVSRGDFPNLEAYAKDLIENA